MNTPNKLTIVRVALIPVFMALFLWGTLPGLWLSLAVFVIATATDALDGYLARKNGQVTTFGKLMDPIADKLLTFSALICFLQADVPFINAWVVIVILAREFIVTGIRLIAADEGNVIAAGIWGKLKTVSQFIMALVAILGRIWLVTAGTASAGLDITLLVLVIISVGLTLYSGCDYVRQNKNMIVFK